MRKPKIRITLAQQIPLIKLMETDFVFRNLPATEYAVHAEKKLGFPVSPHTIRAIAVELGYTVPKEMPPSVSALNELRQQHEVLQAEHRRLQDRFSTFEIEKSEFKRQATHILDDVIKVAENVGISTVQLREYRASIAIGRWPHRLMAHRI